MGNIITQPVGLLLHPRLYGIRTGFMGSISITDSERKIRYLLEDAIVEYRSGQPISYTDILREELNRALERIGRKKMPYLHDSLAYLFWVPPQAADPGTYWDYVYADVKSAYYSIYTKCGLDTQLSLGRYISQGAIRPDWPILEQKRARVALYGFTRTRLARVIRDGGILTIPTRSKYLNPSLHGVIMLILHDLAYQAIMLDAAYVNTDGYILPARNLPALQHYALETWGLHISARSEVGEAHIRGIARYRVGDLESLPYHRSTEPRAREYIPLLPDELQWLKRQWQRFL